MKRTLTLALTLLLTLSLLSCSLFGDKDVWEDAVYTEDTTLGEGAKTVTVELEVEDHLITFTVKTDEEILGDALLAVDLIAGEEGPYGLYVKVVNGMTADYDKDGHYWSLLIDGDYAMTGVDSTEITEGTVYRIVYAK